MSFSTAGLRTARCLRAHAGKARTAAAWAGGWAEPLLRGSSLGSSTRAEKPIISCCFFFLPFQFLMLPLKLILKSSGFFEIVNSFNTRWIKPNRYQSAVLIPRLLLVCCSAGYVIKAYSSSHVETESFSPKSEVWKEKKGKKERHYPNSQMSLPSRDLLWQMTEEVRKNNSWIVGLLQELRFVTEMGGGKISISKWLNL